AATCGGSSPGRSPAAPWWPGTGCRPGRRRSRAPGARSCRPWPAPPARAWPSAPARCGPSRPRPPDPRARSAPARPRAPGRWWGRRSGSRPRSWPPARPRRRRAGGGPGPRTCRPRSRRRRRAGCVRPRVGPSPCPCARTVPTHWKSDSLPERPSPACCRGAAHRVQWPHVGGRRRHPLPRQADGPPPQRPGRRRPPHPEPAMHIRDWPSSERPREKLLAHGAAVLSDAELLALFLGSGVRGLDAVATARRLLAGHGPLRRLLDLPAATLRTLPGLGPASACQLAAALELATRHLAARLERGEALTDPQAAGRYFAQRLRGHPSEVFAAL